MQNMDGVRKDKNVVMIMKGKSKKNILLQIAFILTPLILTGWMVWFHSDYLIDSDMSSELVLGRLLAKDNAILSSDWFYSTELRVLNTQLIYAFFFKIFSDWTVIRTASVLVMLSGLMVIMFYFSKAYKCEQAFGVLGGLLLLPASTTYFSIVLHGAYYIPHIAISFLTLALIEDYYARQKKYLLIILGILSLLAGMGGPRQLFVLYIPLGMTAVYVIGERMVQDHLKLRDIKQFRMEALVYGIPCLGAVAGYLINTQILSRYYIYKEYQLYFSEISWSDIQQLLQGLLNIFGYRTGQVSLSSALCNLASVLWIIYTFVLVIRGWRQNENMARRRLSIYILSAYIIFWLLYIFTSMDYLDRYYIPLMVWSFPLLVLNFREAKGDPGRWMKRAGVLLVFLSVVNCFKTYNDLAVQNNTYYKKEAMNVLCDNEIMNGYATFWNANVLTELSNGKIEVWSWGVESSDEFRNMTSPDEIYEWLQLKDHKKERPEGKVFILLSNAEIASFPRREALESIPCFWYSDEYKMWVFESYEELVAQLQFS